MGFTVQLTSLLSVVSSPPLAQSHCSCSGAKTKQSCSPLRAPPRPQLERRRLRAVQVGGEPSASGAAPEEAQEEPSIDFAFVAVSSLGPLEFIRRLCFKLRRRSRDGVMIAAAAAVVAGRDAGRALQDGARRAEAQGHHARELHRPLRALRTYATRCISHVRPPAGDLALACSPSTCTCFSLHQLVMLLEMELIGSRCCCLLLQDKFLLNCSGGGVCGTCIVEKPKTWRLACQATVGNADSTGQRAADEFVLAQMVIQQLPEWKVHEWDKQK
ncbi:hypothetical protein HU200_034187 [Digitaria exilis]|uniref:Uncharacterized protein n=1 Tax=Digitaria exilis TaxID=1010633 RepID=A0A835EP59_9POAL|nr:hypothetical protein HU200_034187 [Digitaria exilis]